MLKGTQSRVTTTISIVCVLILGVNFTLANTSVETTTSPVSVVNSITLSNADGPYIKWVIDGYSKNGFKVVWSKNEGPTYPSRDGDTYHYLSDPSVRADKLEAFNGDGVYYVRVCEYLGGACGVYSNQIKVQFSDIAALTANISTIKSITLYPRDVDVKWSKDGISQNGFMVVWSKNENPTYPVRDGDKSNYLANPDSYYYAPSAFSGEGTYFVRVCEYMGGACEKFSNQVKLELGSAPSAVTTEPVKTELKEVGGCTADYSPVCGEITIQCITTPCNPIRETFNNKCVLVSKGAKYLFSGECKAVSVVDPKISGDASVKWACYDGTEKMLTGECLKPEAWKAKANEFCADRCKGEKCGINSFSVSARCASANEITNIEEMSKLLTSNGLDAILVELKELRNLVKEQQTELKYLKSLFSGIKEMALNMQDSIKSFITYGVDDNTKKLGEGERAAVMNSFKSAYNKLPETESEMTDAIKIANGRWPSAKSEEAEAMAKEKFQKIYGREADMSNPKDNAAVTIMAYGLRQKAENRKLESEKNGLKIYKDIFKETPSSTEEWNALQAITYSGATK